MSKKAGRLAKYVTEPLPCPFCGSVAQMTITDYEDCSGWKMECDEFECSGSGPERDTEARAIAAWNKRFNRKDSADIKFTVDVAQAVIEVTIVDGKANVVTRKRVSEP